MPVFMAGSEAEIIQSHAVSTLHNIISDSRLQASLHGFMSSTARPVLCVYLFMFIYWLYKQDINIFITF